MLKGRFLFILVFAAIVALAACGPAPTAAYPPPGGTLPAGTLPAETQPAGTQPAGTQAPVGETPTQAGTAAATQPAMTETQAATQPAATATVAANQPAATATVVAGTPEATGTVAIPVTGAVDPGRASKLLGMDVKDKSGASLGKVDDLLIDLKSGAIYLVISATGSSGSNSLIPTPLQVFSWDASSSALSLTVDTATFTGAPGFQSGAYPNTQQSGWDSQFSSYWQKYVPTKTP